MIKNLFIVLAIFLSLGGSGCVFAQSQFSPVIEKMEKSLFGMSYANQNDEARLKRIEENVYGEQSTKPLSQRIAKLSKDLSADSMGQEIKPKADTFEEEDAAIKSDEPKADPNVNYPVVNKLEDKVFNKEFKTLDINKRLSNLEQKAFSRVYNDDLNSRAERLRVSVFGTTDNSVVADSNGDYTDSQTGYASGITPRDLFSRGNYYGPSYNQYNNDPGVYPSDDEFANSVGRGTIDDPQDVVLGGGYGNSFGDAQGNSFGPGIGVPLSALEQSILRKSYPNDPIENRLNRLEAKVFNSNFSQDDPQTRLDRLSSANQARKSAKKYDSNKFAQRASTAIQIGALLLMVLAFVL